MSTGSVPAAIGGPARACVLSLVCMAGPFSGVPTPRWPGCQHSTAVHIPMAATGGHADSQGPYSCHCAHSWPWPWPSSPHVCPCRCTDTYSWPCSPVCARQPLGPPQLLPWSLATEPRGAAEDTLPSQSFLLANLRMLGSAGCLKYSRCLTCPRRWLKGHKTAWGRLSRRVPNMKLMVPSSTQGPHMFP